MASKQKRSRQFIVDLNIVYMKTANKSDSSDDDPVDENEVIVTIDEACAKCSEDTFVPPPLDHTFCRRKFSTTVQIPTCTLSGKVGLQYDDGIKPKQLDIFMNNNAKLDDLLQFVIPLSVLCMQ